MITLGTLLNLDYSSPVQATSVHDVTYCPGISPEQHFLLNKSLSQPVTDVFRWKSPRVENAATFHDTISCYLQ